jgi:hypothetical protein
VVIALELARFVSEAQGLNDTVRAAVLRVILDVLSSALFGLQSPGGRAALEAARKTWFPALPLPTRPLRRSSTSTTDIALPPVIRAHRSSRRCWPRRMSPRLRLIGC